MKIDGKIRFKMVALVGLVLLFMTPVALVAQQKVSDVRVVVRDVRQERDSIRVVLDIEAIGVSVPARGQMYLFPVIRSGMNERKLLPVVISGRIQQAVVNRAERLSGRVEPVYASFSARGQKLFHERISYSATVPLESWMKDANVAMAQERRNCRGEFHHLSMEVIADRIRFAEKPTRVIYELPVELPVPPREEIKIRTESGEAQIIYTVGNAEIKPMLANNRNELDKIRQSIEKVRKVQGVKINSITISSYASPEGTWEYNLKLSERRAASLTRWLRGNYDLAGIALSSRGYGEDWEGLEKLVREDPVMPEGEKGRVLEIIGNTDVFDGRERLLMQYNEGRTYRYMLANLFPMLRRSAYRITFTVPEYSIETIKEVFKSYPSMLSLYEFYLLANQYEPGSTQFKEVIVQAARIFPEEKSSRITMGVFSYLSNDVSAALKFLQGLEDDPEAWIYFSAFHARNNELDKAEYYAKKAVAAGNTDAAGHLRLIERYKADENVYQEKLKDWEMYGMD